MIRDTRHGIRGLRRNPGFTTVAVLSVALVRNGFLLRADADAMMAQAEASRVLR